MRRTVRGIIVAAVIAVALVLPGHAGGAQSDASVALGMTSIRYDSTGALSTLSVAPTFSTSGDRTSLWIMGSGAQLPNAAWSAQLFAVASRSTRMSTHGFVGDVGVMGGGSAHADGARTGQGMATARLAQWRARGGWWGGAQGGVMYDGVESRPIVRGDVGASYMAQGAQWTLTALPTWTQSTTFTDTELQLAVPLARMDLAASLGARNGAELPVFGRDERVWGSVSASYFVTPRAAVVVSAGTYPIDLTQGFPSGRYATVALRVQTSRRAAVPSAGGRASQFSLEPVPGSRAEVVGGAMARHYRLRLFIDAGDTRYVGVGRTPVRVQLNGSVTHWEPATMRAERDGAWVWDGIIPDGMHEVVIRVDDGPWVVPPGLSFVRDEFGDMVGRLVIGV
jgi:hypothetical protein